MTTIGKTRLAVLVALGLFAPASALAHIALTWPPPRYPDQKTGPCGRLNGVRSANVTTLAPGATITVTWSETINHPGHYRISFDADGVDDFADPASYTDFYTNGAVLLDDIADSSSSSMYSATVTLPNVECSNCTLQLVQLMTDKPPYAPGTNDLYYQCADLVLSNQAAGSDAGVLDLGDGQDSGAPPVSPPDGGFAEDAAPFGVDPLPPESSGCDCSTQAGQVADGPSPPWALFLAAAAALLRKAWNGRHLHSRAPAPRPGKNGQRG